MIGSPSAYSRSCTESQDRIEQLAWKEREDLRILDEPLVAPAVEEERPALAVARELDLAEEQRVVAAPVRAHDARDEVRERAFDERRLVNELERRLRRVVGGATRESIGEPGLPRLEDAHAEARALVQQARPSSRAGRSR